jgi:hypothetical protein
MTDTAFVLVTLLFCWHVAAWIVLVCCESVRLLPLPPRWPLLYTVVVWLLAPAAALALLPGFVLLRLLLPTWRDVDAYEVES